MAYFEYFPQTGYDLLSDKNNIRINIVTNILVRIRKKLNITNISFFEQHFISDGDRAEILAYEIYGDSSLHWLIMYANYMTNPFFDWPLTYYDLQKFVAKKYPNNENGIHHYEDEMGYVVDLPENHPAESQYPKIITNFLYEENINDSKRSINIIKQEYVASIVDEFKRLI
jgi:hypothetical protein